MIKAKPLTADPPASRRTKAGPVSSGRLKSFVERIEKLREEKKAIGQDERDVFSEAKGVGYDAPTIRWLLKEREIDAADRDERDTLRDTYAHALGMAVSMVQVEGLSLRQAEAATGVSKSSIQRALAVPALSQDHRDMEAADLGECLPPHDLETGEINPGEGAVDAAKPVTAQATAPPEEITLRSRPAGIMPRSEVWKEITQSCGGRGVAADARDNPPPRGEGLQQGPATTNRAALLPLGGKSGGSDVGNVVKPETGRESAPRQSPPQDLSTRIAGAGASQVPTHIEGAATSPAVAAGLPSEPSSPAGPTGQVHPVPLRGLDEPVIDCREGERSGTHLMEASDGQPNAPHGDGGAIPRRPAGYSSPGANAAERFMSGDVSVAISAAPGSLLDRIGAELEKVAPGKVVRNVSVTVPEDDLTIPAFLDRRSKKTDAETPQPS